MGAADQDLKGSLIVKILFNEIEGKNKAVHAYDGIIWKIRTGFLTLLFAGLGILLTGFIKEGADFEKAKPFVYIMFMVATGIAIPGAIIDLNYVRRKFRVISDLNELFLKGLCLNEPIDENTKRELCKCMRVSGDSGDKSYRNVETGYKGECWVLVLIYSIPVVLLWIGWVYLSC
jgi:hypothetical protein